MAVHLPDAIRNHFAYRSLQTRQNLRELLSVGWRFLAIGLSVLGLCFLAIQWLKISDSSSTAARLLEQSLLILGWVANWRPLEIILYEWLPLWRLLVLQRRLSQISVTVRSAPD
jgi:hypothetical protein